MRELMTNTKRLLARVVARIRNGDFTAAEFAEAAGIEATSLRTMLAEGWSNRAVENVEAIARTLPKMKRRRRKSASLEIRPTGRSNAPRGTKRS